MSRIANTPENLVIVQGVAEAIIGTASALDDRLADAFGIDDLTVIELPLELAEAIDDIAAECEACGWWTEPGDVENGACSECREGEGEG